MKEEFITYIHQNEGYLNYLRHNPKWYEIIENSNDISNFIKTCNIELKQTFKDRFNNMSKKLSLIDSLIKYTKK